MVSLGHNGSRLNPDQVLNSGRWVPWRIWIWSLTWSYWDYIILLLCISWLWVERFRLNSLCPNGAIGWCRSVSTLVQVMTCCITAPSHYLNQCWLIISEVLCHSPEGIYTGNGHTIILYNEFENDFKINASASELMTFPCPPWQWSRSPMFQILIGIQTDMWLTCLWPH